MTRLLLNAVPVTVSPDARVAAGVLPYAKDTLDLLSPGTQTASIEAASLAERVGFVKRALARVSGKVASRIPHGYPRADIEQLAAQGSHLGAGELAAGQADVASAAGGV